MPLLDLPDTPRAAVWRLLRVRLRDDPTLKAVIRTWRIPDGTDTEVWASLEDDALAPALRLVPRMEAMTWYSAEGMKGGLTVDYEVYVAGHDAEDVLNLQGAIESALYPHGDDFRAALVAAGAETGLVEFVEPLKEPMSTDRPGGFRPIGAVRIETLRILIP